MNDVLELEESPNETPEQSVSSGSEVSSLQDSDIVKERILVVPEEK